ncbi:MAG: SWIM zinc finger family protein, partial [Acidobacteria bacterium]|nr:SWIM zinc finger family protein [Acidobacteriota bacterium]
MAEEKALSLRDIVDRSLLYRLAGPRSFGRGVDYFEEGHVHSVTEQDGVVSAKVKGQEEYTVRLWVESGTLSASCTCPMYGSGNFCKHCVATGLAIIGVQRTGEAEPGGAVVNLDDVQEYLRDLDKGALVELLMEQAKRDDCLQERLLLQAASTTGKGPDLGFYRGLIEDAVWADD